MPAVTSCPLGLGGGSSLGTFLWPSFHLGAKGKARTTPRVLEPGQERHGGSSWGLPGCLPLDLGYFGC